MGFPCGSDGKESVCNIGGLSLGWEDPWVGKIPWRSKWLQCSCLENSMDRIAWLATGHGVTELDIPIRLVHI